jgi:hypothetical protein
MDNSTSRAEAGAARFSRLGIAFCDGSESVMLSLPESLLKKVNDSTFTLASNGSPGW